MNMSDGQRSILNNMGDRLHTFGSYGHRLEQMLKPDGVAIDDKDVSYVTSEHKLQKFRLNSELIKCVGHQGNEFNDPCGVTLYNKHVYVCISGMIVFQSLTDEELVGGGALRASQGQRGALELFQGYRSWDLNMCPY